MSFEDMLASFGVEGKLSLCTRVANMTLIQETLQNPERFMSYLFQGKEEFAEMVFNKGADLLNEPHICKEEFQVKVFRVPDDTAICGVIGLPGAESEFDYSVIALKLCQNVSESVVYTLEKGDEKTDLLRSQNKAGESGTVQIVSGVNAEDKFQYVCDWLLI